MTLEQTRAVETVGVVGAGVMGTGVAQSLAQAGLSVVLVDTASAALDRARTGIHHGVRFHHFLRPGSARHDPEEVLGRITFSEDLDPLHDVDFVIENVTERWAVKAPIYAALDRLCAQDCVLAANTSAIAIRRFGEVVSHPGRVLGMHFMNPVPAKDTVEVIRGPWTTEATLGSALALLERIGKSGVVVNDSPGFVSNRVLMLTINEAAALVEEGVAPPEDVDRIFRECFGHPTGPLETADLIGVDTIVLSLEALLEQLDDPKFVPCRLLRELVERGDYGRKSGRGFYEHSDGSVQP
jgi:3-hydroxybutyryl-CoA dehydrogenase